MQVNCSVVIPTYKRPHLLKKCLHALLLQQTSVHFEVIVVADGKDEETFELMKHFSSSDSHFLFSFLDKKSGPAAVRNKGWESANGELILFTDDDTQPSVNWVDSYWKAYVEHGKKDIAFTGTVSVPVSQKPTDYEKNTAGLETAEFVTANCACTKNVLRQIDGFDEDFSMAWREDSELQFKLINNRISIIKVKDAVVLHPVRKVAWGASLREQKKSMFNALLYKKHPRLFRTNISASPLWNYYGMIVCFICALLYYFLEKPLPAFAFAGVWLLLLTRFIAKRLQGSSHSFSHVSEMIVTSLFIPFLSVYWTLYGAIKFKVFFL